MIEEAKLLKKFLKTHHYNIVHIHYTTPLRAFYLKAAKQAGVTTRIYHSHSAEVCGKSKLKILVYKYCKKILMKYGTHFFACSMAAANWVYPISAIREGKVEVIYNGINTEKFSFNEEKRNEIRRELKIQDDMVFINTGRFTQQKNQSFIFKIMSAMKMEYKNIKLILLGDGLLRRNYEDEVNDEGLKEDVIFLGVRENVQDYLCASDCYIMPSLYEGLPVAGIEAQCSGIPCLFSTNITKEVSINKNVKFLSLNQSVEEWAKVAIKLAGIGHIDDVEVIGAGYDIKDVVNKLEKFYLDLAGGKYEN